jgi:phage tail-like protein
MAVLRDQPYCAFNFLVTCDRFDGGDAAKAGFQEVSGIGMEVDALDYRNGNDKSNAVRKVPGLTRVTNVTLKRGVTGNPDFYNWIAAVRDGQNARSDVVIELLDEAHQPVMRWKLHNAWPVKYAAPTLNAPGGQEIAIEELVLTGERLEVE